MGLDYVAIGRIVAFGPNSRFTAYPYRLFHGLTIQAGREARILNRYGHRPYETIELIYNSFEHPDVVHPGLKVLVSSRVRDVIQVAQNVDFHDVGLKKIVYIPYGDSGWDEFLSERLRGITPEQLLLEAPECAANDVCAFCEVVAPTMKDLPANYLSEKQERFFLRQSQKEVLVNVRSGVEAELPLLYVGTTLLLRRCIWRTVEEYFKPRFFEWDFGTG